MLGISSLLNRVLMLLSMVGTLGAVEPVSVILSGNPGPYGVAQWKKDWPGCEFEDGVKEGRFGLVDRDGMRWLRATMKSMVRSGLPLAEGPSSSRRTLAT
jgi:hypothetical protein